MNPKNKALSKKMQGDGEHSKVSFTPKSKEEARKFKKYFVKGISKKAREYNPFGDDRKTDPRIG